MTNAIQDLVLPDPSEATRGRAFPVAPAALAQDVQKPSAFIDKGSVIAFIADVSGQNREDVLNSTLLAQLAADKANNRESDVMGWYATYSNVLSKLGWVSQGFNWQKYTTQKMSFTMDEAVLEVAEAALTGQEELVVAAAINALKKLPKSDGRLQLFNHSASSTTEGNFQISVCTETGGSVAMKTMAFTYDAQQQSTQVLFFAFDSNSTKLNQAVVVQDLNTAVYATVRDVVLQKPGANAKTFVLDLDI